MAATLDTPLLYGDFTNFVVVDRYPSTIELVPHLFGDTNKPTGQRGALHWFCSGSDVVNANGFRLFKAAAAKNRCGGLGQWRHGVAR